MTSSRRGTSRVLLYSHDGFGLGHLRRNLNVAGRLVHEYPGASALVLAGLPGIPGLQLPDGVDLVKLPSIRKVGTEAWQPRSLLVGDDRLQAMRRELIAAAFESLAPDLVLVDYLPAGVWGELVDPLRRLREEHPGTRVVLGLRDVLDAPRTTRRSWETAGHDAALRRLYDQVLVYGDREIFDASEAYGLEEMLPGRVRYTGYLCAEEQPGDVAAEREACGVEEGERLFVITAGGGADAFPMMELTLRAMRLRKASGPRERLVVVTGPLMERADVEKLRDLAQGLPATIQRTADRLTTLIAAADLLITMGAYNTLTDAIRLKRPVLSVPRRGPSAEQDTRAGLFEARKLLTRVAPEADPGQLAAAIDLALTQPRLVAPPPTLDGLARTVGYLGAHLPQSPRRVGTEEDRRAQGSGSHV